MTEVKLYKIARLDTTGWVVTHKDLMRELAKDIIFELIEIQGENPNRLKVIPNHVSIDELPSL